MKKVVILKIEDYNRGILKEKIKVTLEKHFQISKNFKPLDKIVLKPNLLMEARPEEAITTHPLFVEVVGKIFKEMGNAVFVADSPGGFVSNKDMDSIYEKTGIKEVAQTNNFDLLYPTQSLVVGDIPMCWWAADNGKSEGNFKMINLAKLKTHDVMVLTLATKNLYGCISGLHKSHLHKMHPKTRDLTGVVLKLYEMLKPKLNIVDGILSLSGNGPAKQGRPRKLGLVILGDDALYTDYAISKALGIKDNDNPLIKEAKIRGLLKEDELEIVSDLHGETIKNFELPDHFIVNSIPSPLLNLLMPLISFKPVIDVKQCRLCGKCVQVCPKGAIHLNKTLRIDYKHCIMCMCCSEMCPHAAIDVKHSLLIKIIKGIHKCFQ
ncbi:MAG: DUF362 domain-containing protein [Candidatus Omnitrophica bacterium]|jgi:uncharacterized protein (DUF362 family)/Pyruvate/2-oxoacid:ferredoxin oxidoreductase delta subunit|nr:DUF362 domain-containing protein [Candidatus Omnitrophota bacterium]